MALAAGSLILTATAATAAPAADTTSTTAAPAAAGSALADSSQITFADAAGSTGPAQAVPGGTGGGTVNVLQRDTFGHLDPAQVYVNNQAQLATLLHRGLTTYKLDDSGAYSIVGDLATDSGRMSDGGKTWTYTLKDGIKWEDGTPITSTDIRHSVERLFAPFINSGPTYLQQWLAGTNGTDYRDLLPGGPYEGNHLQDSVLSTPDAKTVVFHFEKAQPDLPYALSLAGYGAVPRAKDTKEAYDLAPVASGPYKILEFKPGTSMTLVRNAEWNPATDASRHQYPDRFQISFGVSNADFTRRMMTDTGEDQTTTTFTNSVDKAFIPEIMANPQMAGRTLAGHQSYVAQINFNTKRITSRDLRLALAYAVPTQAVYDAQGGGYGAELAGSFISPTLAGYKKSDPLGKIAYPQGRPDKAREILKRHNKLGMKIRYAFVDTEQGQAYSAKIETALEKAGFDVERFPITGRYYYDVIGKTDNTYDMYASAWGADWPSGLTVIPPVFDGRTVADGASNYSMVNDRRINRRIDSIQAMTDPQEAAAAWMQLSDFIAKQVVPAVPTVYYKQMQMHGSRVGGATYHKMFSNIDPTRLYVKQ
ncbi:ABC transporter substrate-binding protein [Streptomyces sp. APSN-46.1]|uniref:ABC transporter substrate-binding protein n=1 Tax=Streptomyces sp. APSN-46.1 TaxID=2929049 RepID=UPI0027E4C009|nr:ABC transporter substrate-binding protein [Streptomyces sp. APSN-46.1]